MNARFASVAVLFTAASLTACEGARDALTAHTGVAARAERQELSATRLGELLGNSEAPLEREVARALADVWVNYQLLGVAAARGDSLNDTTLIDNAMWAAIASSKARQFYERVATDWGRVDTASAPEAYQRGDLLSAQHILLSTQNAAADDRQARLQRIESIRSRATSANFAQLAREASEDPGSAQRGGFLGVFPRGTMVPQFEQALRSLSPGEISGVFETQFGYHIVRRPTYGEVREEFLEVMGEFVVQRAESLYTVQLDSAARIELRRNAAARARAAALDPDAHRNDRTAIASSTAGPFTTGRLVQWLETFPPQQQITQRIQAAPDSMIEQLVRQFVRNDVVVHRADSLGIRADTGEVAQVRSSFQAQVQQSWFQLRIHPSQLADSAGTQAEKERLAAQRIEAYVEALLANRAPFVPVPSPLQSALRTRYQARVNASGLDRALQVAQRQRGTADAARRQAEPAVPLPQGPPGQPPQGPPGQPPQGQPPQGQPPQGVGPQGTAPQGAPPPDAAPAR
jgi:parvulin-like peptidyl-prolyl isomerase